MPRPQRTHDWEALKVEWLATNLSINQFRETKDIQPAVLYKAIDVEDWYQARSKMHQRTLEKLSNKKADMLVRKYEDYYKLWGAVKGQAASILRKTQKPDGTIEPLLPSELRSLTEALERALKSERLLDGESTENFNTGIDVYNFILKAESNEIRLSDQQSAEQGLETQQPLQNQIEE